MTMNKCSIMVKVKKKDRVKGGPKREGCPNEAKVWLQMDKLGKLAEQDTPCIWLCDEHAAIVHNWGFKK